jgi:hypothetical protein
LNEPSTLAPIENQGEGNATVLCIIALPSPDQVISALEKNNDEFLAARNDSINGGG